MLIKFIFFFGVDEFGGIPDDIRFKALFRRILGRIANAKIKRQSNAVNSIDFQLFELF